MRPQHAKSLAVGSCRTDRVSDSAIITKFGDCGSDMADRRMQVGADDCAELLSCRATERNRSKAFLRVVPVLLQVAGYERIDGDSIVGIDIAACDQQIGNRPRLIPRPCLKRSDK